MSKKLLQKTVSILIITAFLSLFIVSCGGSENGKSSKNAKDEPLTAEQIYALQQIAQLQQQQSSADEDLNGIDAILSNIDEYDMDSPPPALVSDASTDVDYDFTGMNYNMMSALNFELVVNSEEYVGKTIRYEGQFFSYVDPNNNKRYHACLQYDETRCCQVGFDFIVPDTYVFPNDFPEEKTKIRVTGTFACDDTNGISHYYLNCDGFDLIE